MVALPDITSPTLDAIESHYEANQDARHPQRLNARIVSFDCERRGWYAFRWAGDPERFPGRIVRGNYARAGNMGELIQTLRDIGLDVVDHDPKTFQPIDLTTLDGHYRQRPAGTVTGVLQAPKAVHFLYADQKPAAAFRQIKKYGLGVAFPDRMVTLQLGMHLMGLQRAYYIVRCKDDDALYDERIHYDQAHALQLLAKAERIRNANNAPERIGASDSFACRFCASHALCHDGAPALRNCRTCIHSSPYEWGWYCFRHDRDLPVEDQRAGCPNHLYIPSLVNGEQIDADEKAETVTYRMADGREWVDGAERTAA